MSAYPGPGEDEPPSGLWPRHRRLLRFLRWVALIIVVLAVAVVIARIGYNLTTSGSASRPGGAGGLRHASTSMPRGTMKM